MEPNEQLNDEELRKVTAQEIYENVGDGDVEISEEDNTFDGLCFVYDFV